MKIFKGIYLSILVAVVTLASCTPANVPNNGSVNIDAITTPLQRFKGLNEKRDPITRVMLGHDMLVPKVVDEDELPNNEVGPFELRGETLASALQLVLDDYDISIAFESDAAFNKKITVANLKGNLDAVVDRICSLADLYCHFEKGNLTVKDTETFIVDLPPIGTLSTESDSTSSDAYSQISTGLQAIIGTAPTIDSSTRLLIYTATQRTQQAAKKYFDKLRKNTALVVFETNIWEVTLDNDNRTGIDWSALSLFSGSRFNISSSLTGGVGSDVNPITLTANYTSGDFTASDTVFQFISTLGSVKTISQPQITVLSGSKATMEIKQEENYISEVTREEDDNGDTSVSTTTDTVETGLTLSIKSAWDDATVYGGIDIALDDLLSLENFPVDTETTIQLPKTTTRSLQTEIRVRPGDAILIGGLISEKDNSSDTGLGFLHPLFSTTKSVQKENSELVFLLRPRVVVFEMGDERNNQQMVNAPSSGVEAPALNLTDETKNVKEMFEHKPSPIKNLTDKIGDMFNFTKSKVEEPKEVVPADGNLKADEKVDKILEDYNSYQKTDPNDTSNQPINLKDPVKTYGAPVSSPRDILKATEVKPSEPTIEKKVEENKETENKDNSASGGLNE